MKILLRIGGLVLFSFLASCAHPGPQIFTTSSPHLPRQARAISVPHRSQSLTLLSATLQWDANLPEEQIAFYNVYEVLPRTPTLPMRWGYVGTVNGTQLAITGLVPGSWHIYAVTAVNVLRESGKAFAAPYRAQ